MRASSSTADRFKLRQEHRILAGPYFSFAGKQEGAEAHRPPIPDAGRNYFEMGVAGFVAVTRSV